MKIIIETSRGKYGMSSFTRFQKLKKKRSSSTLFSSHGYGILIVDYSGLSLYWDSNQKCVKMDIPYFYPEGFGDFFLF